MILNKINFTGKWHRASGNVWPSLADRNAGNTPSTAIRAHNMPSGETFAAGRVQVGSNTQVSKARDTVAEDVYLRSYFKPGIENAAHRWWA